MKKQIAPVLFLLICLLLGVLLGIYLGRNTLRHPVVVSIPENTVPDLTVTYVDTQAYQNEPVNINTAGIYELASLPGIGETLAVRIVEYRNINGAFAVPEELIMVDGIGTAKLEAILDLITTGG